VQGMVDEPSFESFHRHLFPDHVAAKPRVGDVSHEDCAYQPVSSRIEHQLAKRGIGFMPMDLIVAPGGVNDPRGDKRLAEPRRLPRLCRQ